MTAIYRKELRLAFSSLSTYILYSLLLLAFGVLSSVFNLFLGYASLSYPLGYMTVFLILLLPLLLFFADRRERKGGMEPLLFSLPLSPAVSVIGAFLGQLTLFLIPTLLLALLPPLYSLFGASQILSSEVALLGYFLYSMLLIALNRLLFSAIKRPLISLLASILLNLSLYLFHQISVYIPTNGIFESILPLLNPTGMYYSFTYGKFNLLGVIYFLTFTAALVFCEILIKKKARGDFSNKKRAAKSTCALVLALLLTLLSNTLLTLLPEKISNPDVTGNDVFRISNTTLEELKKIDSPIEIYLLCAGGKNTADKDFLSFLKKYSEESEYLTLTVIDTDQAPDFASSYTSDSLSDQSLIVEGNGHFKILDRADLYYYLNPNLGEISSADYEFLLQSYLTYIQTGSTAGATEQAIYYGQLLYSTASLTTAHFNGDELLCNAIRFAAKKEVPVAYIAVEDTFAIPDTLLRSQLEENGFFVKALSRLASIPSDCDVLILFSPKRDVGEAEGNALSAYLQEGGNLFLTTDYTKTDLPILLSVLGEYGLSTVDTPHILCESNPNVLVSGEENPYFFSTKIASSPATGEDFKDSFVSILAHSITLTETEGVTHTKWLTTGNSAYLRDPENSETIEEGRYCCGAIAEKEHSRVLWISSPLSVSSTGFVASENGGNLKLLLSAFHWMCDSSFEPARIESTTVNSSTLFVPNEQLAIWVTVIALLIPIIPVSIGIIYTYVRKKR